MNDQQIKQVVTDKNATLAAELAWSNDDAWRALRLATAFHETYERLAPSFGYETRPETRAFNAKSDNGRLMIAVCGEILSALSHPPASQPAAEPSEALKTWPARIWIQHGDDEVPNFDEAYLRIEDMTWCHDKMDGADVEYIRADLASTPSEAQAAPVDAHFNAMQIVHEEAGRTLSRDDFDLCMRVAKRALGKQPAVPHGWKHALHLAVGAIYFNDSSDYLGALWDVVRHLAPELVEELERDPSGVWHKTAVAPGATVSAPMLDSNQEGGA